MAKSNILITGGAGFIGSHLTDLLLSHDYEVRVLDSLEPQVHPGGQKPGYLNSKAKFWKGAVRDRNLQAAEAAAARHQVAAASDPLRGDPPRGRTAA